jgi:malate dehydrogenase (oxaloacetate-decarboxylating)(NADP+)
MKIAAAEAIANLAKEPVPDEVSRSYSGRKMQYGPNYIIPVPFDWRLISTVSPAVAKAAMDTGVAGKPIADFEEYRKQLTARLDPTFSSMNFIFEKVKSNPKRVIFSEGEEEPVIRAAIHWRNNKYGTPILVGRKKNIREITKSIDVNEQLEGIEIWNAANVDDKKIEQYIEYLYEKTQRKGNLHRDCVRLVKNARNIFASCMLACGDGDALVAGVTRGYHITLAEIRKVIDVKAKATLFGMSVLISNSKSIFIADTAVNEDPSATELADLAEQCAHLVENSFGHVPRVAMLSFSNFGNPPSEKADKIKIAIEELDKRKVNFEYDGEMNADVALNKNLQKLYPFIKLQGPANILIMPALDTANITSKLLSELGSGSVIGPIICGLEHQVQIVQMGANVSDILNMAAYAAAGVAK